jgi:arylsulfatase A-like enzyme
MDDNIGYVLKKLEDMGQIDNTLIVFTTDNGAEAISFPDGGVTPFKGQKGEAWEGYRAPMVVRWPGHIRPGGRDRGQDGGARHRVAARSTGQSRPGTAVGLQDDRAQS